MLVPGLPIMYCNSWFEDLTGYSASETIGKNCRFLQGPQTEPKALNKVITAVRKHEACSVTITNHRKDGAPFANNLSLHPVHDSRGVYRYCIGVLSDCGSAALRTPHDLLCKALPSTFDVALQPPPGDKFAKIDPIAQWKHFQKSNSKMIRLLWATDADGALRKLFTMAPPLGAMAVGSIREYLTEKQHADAPLMEALVHGHDQGTWVPLQGQIDRSQKQ